MQFESLADNVLIELFDYFDAVHLLRAFVDLNSRFNILVFRCFRSFHLDLRRIQKQDFDVLCHQHLRSIIDRIISFHLIQQDETPGLVQLFLSRGFNIQQFTHLKSLTLRDIDSTGIMRNIGQLRHLVHLDVSRCDISGRQDGVTMLTNQIWSLPHLKYCKLDSCCMSGSYFNENTTVLPNLESLFICCAMSSVKAVDLLYLFMYAPQLRFLSIYIELFDQNHKLPIFRTSITTLKLRCIDNGFGLDNVFQSTPCLRHLTINMGRHVLNGHQWKQLIITYLPDLKTFRFMMFDNWSGIPGNNQEIEEQLDTFRTPFWLDEHQWCVCCDWEGESNHTRGHKCFYTLPYAFDYFGDTAKGIRRSRSACPDQQKYWSFHRVHKFESRSSDKNRQYQYPVGFLNVQNLQILIPEPEMISHMIPVVDHLTKLYITICGEGSDWQIQALIERAPHLDTLIVQLLTQLSKIDVLFRLRNPSIRRLRLLPFVRHAWPDFDQARCSAFAQSPLARQCEFLEIRVKSPESIITLTDTMTNLRSMIIHLTDDQNEPPRPTTTGLIEWTQNHLPTRYSISSCESTGNAIVMKLWIASY